MELTREEMERIARGRAIKKYQKWIYIALLILIQWVIIGTVIAYLTPSAEAPAQTYTYNNSTVEIQGGSVYLNDNLMTLDNGNTTAPNRYSSLINEKNLTYVLPVILFLITMILIGIKSSNDAKDTIQQWITEGKKNG